MFSAVDLRLVRDYLMEAQITQMARVLLVDDHRDFCDVLAQLLAVHGNRVEVCADGERALESMTREAPDAVVSDDRLPGMSGLDLLRTIRENPRFVDIPVIICSAADSPREEAMEAGANDFWLKGSDTVFDAVEQFGRRLKQMTSRI